MPTLKVNEIISYSGNTLSLGTSGDTVTVPANVTFNALSGNVYIPNGIIKLDSITTSATATYNLTYGGSAYSPASATACLVSVNGVLQTPGTAFTISGSQITFSSALNPTDVINFIIVLAAPYTINAPGDGTVTITMLASGFTLPVANGGTNLSSGFANGITEADQWRLTADLTGTDGVISANLERIDTAGQGTFGTGMTQSSGIFTFPSTGIWLVMFQGSGTNASSADNMTISIDVTTNNSTYANIALTSDSAGGVAQDQRATFSCSTFIDVTSTANVKVRFQTSSFQAGSTLSGDTTLNWATFTFIRLGNT
jgi:hypothetical protein